MPADPLPRTLDGGLVLRRSRAADAEALATFNARIHADEDGGMPGSMLELWTRDLMRGDHPTFGVDDFTVVEDTEGRIVSALNLIPQTWSYAGIEFGVGRIELVGTDPAYRRRGFIAAQMGAVHEWCRARQLHAQVITGVPHLYRRFGYEMALQLMGGRAGTPANVPKLEGDEPYTVRSATVDDAPFLAATYARARDGWLVADVWDEAAWRCVLQRTPGSLPHFVTGLIESVAGERAGFVAHWPTVNGGILRVIGFELDPVHPWPKVVPSVLRYLKAFGGAVPDGSEVNEIAMSLGEEHPVYQVAARWLRRTWAPYGWYVRVPDLVGFLRHIYPVLEWRVADSAFAGFDGALRLHLSDSGVEIRFAAGLIEATEPWQPDSFDAGDVIYPGRSFLPALFGMRSFGELQNAYPDLNASTDVGQGLAGVLFPKLPSNVIGME